MDKEKQYYIVISKERKGPYSFEDLRNIELTKETLVWTAGMPTWKKLAEVEDLCELIKETPPPIPTEHPSVNIKTPESILIEISKHKQNYDSLKSCISKKVNAIKKWFAQECVFVFKLICFIIATALIASLCIYIHTSPPQISEANQIAYNEESAKRKALCDKLWEEVRYKTDDEIRIILDKNGLHEVGIEHEYYRFLGSLRSYATGLDCNTSDLRKKYLNLEDLYEWRSSLNRTMYNSIHIGFGLENLNETMTLEHKKAFNEYVTNDILECCLVTFIFIWLGRNIFFSIRWFVRWVTRNK